MQYKRITAAITIAVLAVLLLGCTQPQGGSNTQETTPTATGETATPDTSLTTSSNITLEEVSAHNVQSDCWTIVNGKVYDVTQMISSHPGGKDPIICGGDSTTNFNSRMGNGPHPPKAMEALQKMYKGDIQGN